MNDELISRSELKELFESDGHLSGYIEAFIDDCPAADAVSAVRCKDCFYWMKAKVNRNGNLVCPKSGMEIVATDYCSRAEKRKCHYGR